MKKIAVRARVKLRVRRVSETMIGFAVGVTRQTGARSIGKRVIRVRYPDD